MRRFFTIIAVLAVICVVLGFVPDAHPAFDSVALTRPLCAVGCLFGLAVQHKGARVLFCAVAATAFVATLLFVPMTREGGDLRVYTKNVLASNTDVDALVADIRSSDAHIVALQELTVANDAVMDRIADIYPHQARCDARAPTHFAVATRLPITGESTCSIYGTLTGLRVLWKDTPVWAVSLHVRWHWPINSRPREQEAIAHLRALEGPVVLAGDFNSFPWTQRMRQYAAAVSGQVAGPLMVTYKNQSVPLSLPIDYVIAPGGGQVTRRPRTGSDHFGVLAHVRIQ